MFIRTMEKKLQNQIIYIFKSEGDEGGGNSPKILDNFIHV
jgi:hypothetical protein